MEPTGGLAQLLALPQLRPPRSSRSAPGRPAAPPPTFLEASPSHHWPEALGPSRRLGQSQRRHLLRSFVPNSLSRFASELFAPGGDRRGVIGKISRNEDGAALRRAAGRPDQLFRRGPDESDSPLLPRCLNLTLVRNRADRTNPGGVIGVGPTTYSDTNWADFLPAPVR
jgi:hypothetical protein